jgi:hypothetical protein
VLTNLAWPVAAVVIAVVAAVTVLGWHGTLAASDLTTIYVLILGAVGITATAHVTANAVNQAASPPAPSATPEKLV